MKLPIISLILVFVFSLSNCNNGDDIMQNTSSEDNRSYLEKQLDKFHEKFNVYTDLDAAGNHFVMHAKLNNAPSMTVGHTDNPESGTDCIKAEYTAGGGWGGWYFMNGILQGNQTAPEANWGDYPNAGINLGSPGSLTFCARGETGNERVEFFIGGVGRDPENGIPTNPYPDSPKISIGYMTLSTEWKLYTIETQNEKLDYVLGGFGWVASDAENNNQSITFYIDEIKYHVSRLNEPRLLVSYEVENEGTDFDKIMRNVSFVYDDALALIAFLSEGNTEDAKLIADAFVYISQNDRFYPPGHIRNGYMGGDLKTAPGWTPNGREFTVRMPGWTENNQWFEDEFVVSTHTGNAAWMMLGLLSYYEYTGKSDINYFNAAKIVGDWIDDNCHDSRGKGGYTAGFSGWEPAPAKLLYKATEHNIDLWAAFQRMYLITKDNVWKDRAEHAKNFVTAMYDTVSTGGKFFTGTTDDGVTINKSVIPLDIQPWAILSLKDEFQNYLPSLNYADSNISVGSGYAFSDFDLSTAWMEGTGQMAAVYAFLNNNEKYNEIMGFIESNLDVSGALYATQSGTLQTGFDWTYFHRKHVGATAWYIIAKNKVNPFWFGAG